MTNRTEDKSKAPEVQHLLAQAKLESVYDELDTMASGMLSGSSHIMVAIINETEQESGSTKVAQMACTGSSGEVYTPLAMLDLVMGTLEEMLSNDNLKSVAERIRTCKDPLNDRQLAKDANSLVKTVNLTGKYNLVERLVKLTKSVLEAQESVEIHSKGQANG